MEVAFAVSYAVLWAIVVVQGLALMEMVRHLGTVHSSDARLPHRGPPLEAATDKPLPDLVGVSAVDGRRAQWPTAQRRRLVVLLTTTCGPCQQTAVDLVALARTTGEHSITAVVEAPISSANTFIDAVGIPRELAVIDDGARTAVGLPQMRPLALVVESGRIARASVPHGLAQLRELLSAAPLIEVAVAQQAEAGAAPSRG